MKNKTDNKTKEKIKKIFLKHTLTQNSFIDDNGKNHFNLIIDELLSLLKAQKTPMGVSQWREIGKKYGKFVDKYLEN